MRLFSIKHAQLKAPPLDILKNGSFTKRFIASVGCHHLNEKDISTETKVAIEEHWSSNVRKGSFDSKSQKPKKYVLSMFPYPSGLLHMGHVRVYTLSDSMARFYKLNGFNVIHPMGWDAFGLPAENAAIQRKISPDSWTQQNIGHMREQLNDLGCAFDWDREFATCDPTYYKWTQKLFLKMFREGLAYQKEALVNWDPVDKTVLAHEQVDENGCSWRSGAKVEKKLLKQWFIRTTRFSKALYDGLDDPLLEDWKDIVKIQKHWIGECDGYSFDFSVKDRNDQFLTVWTREPEDLNEAIFVGVKSDHHLAKENGLRVFNPIHQVELPVVVSDSFEFPDESQTYIGLRSRSSDSAFAKPPEQSTKRLTRDEILESAKNLNVGGFPVSSKLEDWLISRQRAWGTPIPVVHCGTCGSVPVPDEDLPVVLSVQSEGRPQDWTKTKCPKCGNEAHRETDTMDTFVDSSWYFLRFLSSHDRSRMFDPALAKKFMPVDLYVGGKEHAVLHLYYARFINHFLFSKDLVPHPEPFKRLLVQGMVMGQAYRVNSNGKYIPASEVEFTDQKKTRAVEKTSGEPVSILWEKMSKSKFNGVDPAEVIRELGCDSLRLIMLGDVAPASQRNWSAATFPGILMWQNRLWLTVNEFLRLRTQNAPVKNPQKLAEEEAELLDARNFFVAGVSYSYSNSHMLSVAITKMQGLTKAIRRSSEDAIVHSANYERALMSLLIMISPMAPHFASELWSRFVSTPHRKNAESPEVAWEEDVLNQRWPEVDPTYEPGIVVKVNNTECAHFRFPQEKFALLQREEVLALAMANEAVVSQIGTQKVLSREFELFPGYRGTLKISVEKEKKKQKKR